MLTQNLMTIKTNTLACDVFKENFLLIGSQTFLGALLLESLHSQRYRLSTVAVINQLKRLKLKRPSKMFRHQFRVNLLSTHFKPWCSFLMRTFWFVKIKFKMIFSCLMFCSLAVSLVTKQPRSKLLQIIIRFQSD